MGVKELIQFLMHVVPDALLHLHLPEADMEEHQDKQEPTEDRVEAAEKAQRAAERAEELAAAAEAHAARNVWRGR